MKEAKAKRKTSATLKLHVGQLRALEVAVRLRIESLEDSGEGEQTYGWKIVYRKIAKALQELGG